MRQTCKVLSKMLGAPQTARRAVAAAAGGGFVIDKLGKKEKKKEPGRLDYFFFKDRFCED